MERGLTEMARCFPFSIKGRGVSSSGLSVLVAGGSGFGFKTGGGALFVPAGSGRGVEPVEGGPGSGISTSIVPASTAGAGEGDGGRLIGVGLLGGVGIGRCGLALGPRTGASGGGKGGAGGNPKP